MKKLFIVVLLAFLLLAFMGCNEKTYLLKNTVDLIECIEIVSAQNSLEFTVIKTLSEKEQNIFLEQFQMIEFNSYFMGDPMSVNGRAVKINYKNGDYEIICHYWAEFVKNGEVYFVRKWCDEISFNQLINDFL